MSLDRKEPVLPLTILNGALLVRSPEKLLGMLLDVIRIKGFPKPDLTLPCSPDSTETPELTFDHANSIFLTQEQAEFLAENRRYKEKKSEQLPRSKGHLKHLYSLAGRVAEVHGHSVSPSGAALHRRGYVGVPFLINMLNDLKPDWVDEQAFKDSISVLSETGAGQADRPAPTVSISQSLSLGAEVIKLGLDSQHQSHQYNRLLAWRTFVITTHILSGGGPMGIPQVPPVPFAPAATLFGPDYAAAMEHLLKERKEWESPSPHGISHADALWVADRHPELFVLRDGTNLKGRERDIKRTLRYVFFGAGSTPFGTYAVSFAVSRSKVSRGTTSLTGVKETAKTTPSPTNETKDRPEKLEPVFTDDDTLFPVQFLRRVFGTHRTSRIKPISPFDGPYWVSDMVLFGINISREEMLNGLKMSTYFDPFERFPLFCKRERTFMVSVGEVKKAVHETSLTAECKKEIIDVLDSFIKEGLLGGRSFENPSFVLPYEVRLIHHMIQGTFDEDWVSPYWPGHKGQSSDSDYFSILAAALHAGRAFMEKNPPESLLFGSALDRTIAGILYPSGKPNEALGSARYTADSESLRYAAEVITGVICGRYRARPGALSNSVVFSSWPDTNTDSMILYTVLHTMFTRIVPRVF